MAATEDSPRKALAEKQSSVHTQGNTIRLLKEAKSSKMEIDAAVAALSALKLEKASIGKQLQAAISGASGDGSLTREAFSQAAVNTSLERWLFCDPSFKIYRGVAGLNDYGPPGSAMKSMSLDFGVSILFWRRTC